MAKNENEKFLMSLLASGKLSRKYEKRCLVRRGYYADDVEGVSESNRKTVILKWDSFRIILFESAVSGFYYEDGQLRYLQLND